MEKNISIIMTVYNEKSSYLKEAIESILYQSFRDFEYLIIDDGSTLAETQEVLAAFAQQDPRIQLYRNSRNQGLTASLNRALSLASGKYIARLDSDDIARPERLEKQFSFMEEHPDYALCGTWATIINEEGLALGEKRFATEYSEIKKRLLYFNFFTHSSLFIRRQTLLTLGGYDPAFKKAQDYALLLKISARSPIAIVPEFLCALRVHQESISARSKKTQEYYALRARFHAIQKYGYPWWEAYKILPALGYFLLVPPVIEKKLMQCIHNYK